MLEPRRFRIAGRTTLGAVLVAGSLVNGCSSEPKSAPPATAKAGAAKPGAAPAAKPGTAPAGKTTEVAAAKPAEQPKAEPAKPAEQPKAPPKAPPTNEYPPAPPVSVPETPKRVEPSEKEVSLEEAIKASNAGPRSVTGEPISPDDSTGVAAVVPVPPEEKTRLEDEKTLKALSEERRIELEKMKFLAKEPMTDYVTPVGGGYFYVPRGSKGPDDWVGSGLFSTA